jgi:hypothetical protein
MRYTMEMSIRKGKEVNTSVIMVTKISKKAKKLFVLGRLLGFIIKWQIRQIYIGLFQFCPNASQLNRQINQEAHNDKYKKSNPG